MPQFFIPPDAVSRGTFSITGAEAHHLAKAMRLKAGDIVRLFDGKGRRFFARIDRFEDGGRVSGTLVEEIPETQPSVRLHLHLSVLPRDRFEDALEKCTELGVASIRPLLTERTVAKLDDFNSKRERWEAVCLAACKQSLRSRLPILEPPADFDEAVESCRGRDAWIAWEKEKALLPGLEPGGSEIHLFIGPEGGFSDGEIAAARSAGVRPFSLGPNILRSETAAAAAAALFLLKR